MRRRTVLGTIITSYGDWEVVINVDNSSIANTGGAVNITTSASRNVYWSDKSVTVETGTPTLSVSSGTLTGNKLTISANTSTSVKNITIQASYEGVTNSVNVQLAGKTITQYTNWAVSVSANPSSGISAAGGQVTITGNASRTATWTDNSTTTETATPTYTTNLGSISGNILTIPANQTTNTKTATVTATYSGVSKTCTVTQNADTISSYGDVKLTVGTIADVPAGGGSSTSTGSSATLVLTWTSGRNTTVYPTITEGSISNVKSKGTTVSDRTSLGTVTITATGQGSKSASKTLTVHQQANSASYGAISISSHGSASDIPAAGGDRTASGGSGTQKVTYTSGSERAGTVTCGSYSKVSASSLGTTEKIRTHVGTSTATLTGEGSKTATVSVKVYLAANSRAVTSIYLVPYQPDSTWITTVTNGNWNTVPASGGYLKSYGYYRYTYTSGSTKDELATSDASLSWNTGYNSWITSHTNGGYYVANRTITAGDARSATGTWSAAGFTATKAFTLAANTITNSNYNPYISAYGTPSVSIGSGITAGGGSATVSHSVSNTQTYYQLYTSGSTTTHTRSVAGTTTIKILSNGNNRFSLSGTKLSHSTMGTSATTDTCTIRAINSGDTSKVKDASVSATNAITSYGNVTVSSHGSASDIPASGGTIKASGGSGTLTITYTSGSTRAGSVSCGAYSGVSANSLGTTTKSRTHIGNSTATLTGEGSKTASVSVAVYLQANAVTNSAYLAYNGGYWASCSIGSGITAGGGSATVSKSAGHTYYYRHLYTSGSVAPSTSTYYSSAQTDNCTIAIVSNGNSRFSLSGTTLSHSSMTTNVTTDTCTVRCINNSSTSTTKDASTSVTNSTTYGAISVVNHGNARDIPASGGTVRASGGSATLTISFTSGSSRAGKLTITTYTEVTAQSLGTTVKDRTLIGNSIATAIGEGSKTATLSVGVYLAANKAETTEVKRLEAGYTPDNPIMLYSMNTIPMFYSSYDILLEPNGNSTIFNFGPLDVYRELNVNTYEIYTTNLKKLISTTKERENIPSIIILPNLDSFYVSTTNMRNNSSERQLLKSATINYKDTYTSININKTINVYQSANVKKSTADLSNYITSISLYGIILNLAYCIISYSLLGNILFLPTLPVRENWTSGYNTTSSVNVTSVADIISSVNGCGWYATVNTSTPTRCLVTASNTTGKIYINELIRTVNHNISISPIILIIFPSVFTFKVVNNKSTSISVNGNSISGKTTKNISVSGTNLSRWLSSSNYPSITIGSYSRSNVRLVDALIYACNSDLLSLNGLSEITFTYN